MVTELMKCKSRSGPLTFLTYYWANLCDFFFTLKSFRIHCQRIHSFFRHDDADRTAITSNNRNYDHCHSSIAPSYVTYVLHEKPSHTRNTRASSHTMPLLSRPAHNNATLGRSFSFDPSVWNSILKCDRCAPSLSSSKSPFQICLFRSFCED